MKANEKSVALISLGCDKNTVDSERILYQLKNAGFQITTDLESANIIIVNTCAFILDAQKESIDNILRAETYKKNNCEKLIVCGCMVPRNGEELKNSIGSIDLLVNINEYDHIAEMIYELYNEQDYNICQSMMPSRILSTPNHYAYVKIADGCDNFCTYCTIPKIRGRYRSRKIEDIVQECTALAENGVKELILVAQDVTRYGIDLYNEYKITDLLKELVKIPNIQWIRLHYCYPELIDDRLLNLIETEDKICKYLDIPLQHISDDILKRMNRKSTNASICEFIEKIQKMPIKIAVRSSFIVGFPYERKTDFIMLKEFLIKYKLDNVGVFAYSREEGTPAYSMPHQVNSFIKERRRKILYNVQKKVVKENNESYIGKTIRCICDDFENEIAIMRNEYNSPNVDTVIYCDAVDGLEQGAFYDVKILGYNEYDLLGEIIKRSEV